METGEVFKIRESVKEGEITGVYPVGQEVGITFRDGAYQIMVNGFKGTVSKELFTNLFERIEKAVVEPKIEGIIEPKVKKSKKVVK